jgi:hypothetical protein
MGEDSPGVTYLDLLDRKIERDLPEVQRRWDERQAIYQQTIAERTNYKNEIEPTGDEFIDSMNSEFFVAWNPEETECLYWRETEEKVEWISDQSLSKWRPEEKVFADGKKTNGIAYWKKHTKSRRYKKVLFAPMLDLPPDHYNLFKGYARKPREGMWARFREFWYNVICDGDARLYEYMFCWCAQMIQRPYILPGVAIVLYSEGEGTGKNTFTTAIGSILGKDMYMSENDHEKVFGKFNGHTERAILINMNEAEGSPNRKTRDAIKHAITEPTKGVEHKGAKRYHVRNYTRYILSTNNKDAVHLGKTDRRHLIVQPNESHMGDLEYFRAVYEELESGGIESLMHDLLLYDLDASGIDLRTIPDTHARQIMRAASLSDVSLFWRE